MIFNKLASYVGTEYGVTFSRITVITDPYFPSIIIGGTYVVKQNPGILQMQTNEENKPHKKSYLVRIAYLR